MKGGESLKNIMIEIQLQSERLWTIINDKFD